MAGTIGPSQSIRAPMPHVPMQLGGARGRGTVTLTNAEPLPFSFTLDKDTYEASDKQVRL